MNGFTLLSKSSFRCLCLFLLFHSDGQAKTLFLNVTARIPESLQRMWRISKDLLNQLNPLWREPCLPAFKCIYVTADMVLEVSDWNHRLKETDWPFLTTPYFPLHTHTHTHSHNAAPTHASHQSPPKLQQQVPPCTYCGSVRETELEKSSLCRNWSLIVQRNKLALSSYLIWTAQTPAVASLVERHFIC